MYRLTCCALLVLAVAGCDDHHASGGAPTGAVCPPASTLTYESFGAPFAEAYCTRCHSSTQTGADRNGAPLDHDFDSLNGILAVADHIDEYAAAGPDGTNEIMPPSNPRPSDAERLELGQWLACEVAQQ